MCVADRKEVLSLEKLEAKLKACLCRMSFSKAKVRYPHHTTYEIQCEYMHLIEDSVSILSLALLAVRARPRCSLSRDPGRPIKGHDGDDPIRAEIPQGTSLLLQ